MMILEVFQDLLLVDESYYLVHCISADFKLGAGIAKVIDDKFQVREQFKRDYGEQVYNNFEPLKMGLCLQSGRVLNLVTKKNYYDKPTYNTIKYALDDLLRVVKEKEIKKIAMPLIGCGLDRLEWEKVRKIVNQVFINQEIEILVCVYM